MSFRFLYVGILAFGLFVLTDCGVKGQPQFPDYPAYIGKGLIEAEEAHTVIPSPTPLVPVITPTPIPTLMPSPTPRPKVRKK